MNSIESFQISKRTRDAEQTRSAILQAALDEFAQLGFAGATIRGIAARTELSHAIIRYHFDNKEHLWRAAVDFLFERAESELILSDDELLQLQNGDLDVYRNLLRRGVRYSAKHPEHTRIVMQESVLQSSRFRYYTETYLPDYIARFERLVELLKGLGVVPEAVSSMTYHYMVTGAVNTLYATAEEAEAVFGASPIDEKTIANHSEAIVQLFCPNE